MNRKLLWKAFSLVTVKCLIPSLMILEVFCLDWGPDYLAALFFENVKNWGKEKERFCWATNLNSKDFALLSTGLLLITNATILIHLFLLKDFNEFCMTAYSHMNSNSVLLSGEKLEAGISKRISNIILRFHFSNMKMFKVCEPAVLEGTIAICTLYSLHVTKKMWSIR